MTSTKNQMKSLVLCLITVALFSLNGMTVETQTTSANRAVETGRPLPVSLTGSHEKRQELAPQVDCVDKLRFNDPATNRTQIACQTNQGPAIGESIERGDYAPDDKYRLHIGDRLTFQVLEDRDAAKIVVIADSGELDVPYIGRIPALDKTCHQLAMRIKADLEKEYYYHASIVLALETSSRVLGRVYVWGQVRTQGPIDLTPEESLTVGKAVLRAGGFGDFANKKKVKVVRPSVGDRPKEVFELNLVEILEQGQTDKDLPLQSNDAVIVSSRFINF
jgi:polysaccharide export outer membrane protein